MDTARYKELTTNLDARLTQAELDAGHHFCLEWDHLLVGPGTPEWGDGTDCRCGFPAPLTLDSDD